MTSIDFSRYPDRFALEAQVRQMRHAEVDRLARALAAWVGSKLSALQLHGPWVHQPRPQVRRAGL